MKLQVTSYSLRFRHPFGVSSNIRYSTPTVLIRLQCADLFGYGEACLPAYLGEREEETLAFLRKAETILSKYDSPIAFGTISDSISKIDIGHQAAKAAVDIALCDLAAQSAGLPYHAFRSLPVPRSVTTSCTVAIDHENLLEKKIQEAAEFSILKIKLGTENDRRLIERIRSITGKPLYVDVNQGWRDKIFALEMLHFLKENKVLLAEQPMPVEMTEEMAWLTERSPLPTFADESVKLPGDVEKLKGVFSGINIKLMKCGGLRNAEQMIRLARAAELKVMLGCMAESSCATTAMAHLAGMADFIDLDAPALITNDPFEGIRYHKGKIVLNGEAGTGVRPIPGIQLWD